MPSAEIFQFPFPRDSLCDQRLRITIHSQRYITFSSLFLGIRFATCCWLRSWQKIRSSFSSLFLGIRFATRSPEPQGAEPEAALSVPFSSGFALRPFSPCTIRIVRCLLSVPFSSGFALRPSYYTDNTLKNILSVPFSSGFALRQAPRAPAGGGRYSFSSLFLGIRFATW